MFEIAGSPKNVVCVAVDYAKTKHVALICDGNGDVLKAAFPVDNSREGVAHLLKELPAKMRRSKVPKSQVFDDVATGMLVATAVEGKIPQQPLLPTKRLGMIPIGRRG